MAYRRTNSLDLSPELPEVRSEDFNLFYRPEAEPLPQGLKDFANSLDRFVNDGLVDAYVVNEKKKKKEGEAEAEKDVRMGKEIDTEKELKKNKLGFYKKTSNGTIPKEANPYYLDKYKELTLNNKANLFKTRIYTKYAEKNVGENPSPTAFQDFYKDELKLFIAENQLGSYDAVDLEKGFFSKTSAMKNQLLQTHVTSQMSRISEEFKTNFMNNVQGLFDPSKSMEENGKAISEFIKGYENILSHGTSQKYLLEAMMDYAEKTGDFETAEKMLSELPNHIQLGTGKLGDIKGLEDDFQAIKEKLQERADQKVKDDNSRKNELRDTEVIEATDFADIHLTLSDAMASTEWKDFSEYKKDQIRKVYAGREIGFNTKTNPNVEDGVNKKLMEGDIAGAMSYLNNSIPELQQTKYNELKEKIQEFKISGKDGLLASPTFTHYKGELTKLMNIYAQSVRNTGIKLDYDPLLDFKFEQEMISWLADNPVSEKLSATRRKTEFKKYIKDEYEEIKNRIIGAVETGTVSFGNTTTKKADKSEIGTVDTSEFDENDEGVIKKGNKDRNK